MTDIVEHISQAIDHFAKELSTLRTGRATPALIEDLLVEAYGVPTPLQQLGSISTPEPRLLVVQPWDTSVLKDIEKALSQSSLGIMPVVDGKVIRLPLPSMTEERRQQLVKVVSEKAEEARVRIRQGREDVLKSLKTRTADGEVSEDVAEQEKAEVQTAVTEATTTIQDMVKKKTEEIMTV